MDSEEESEQNPWTSDDDFEMPSDWKRARREVGEDYTWSYLPRNVPERTPMGPQPLKRLERVKYKLERREPVRIPPWQKKVERDLRELKTEPEEWGPKVHSIKRWWNTLPRTREPKEKEAMTFGCRKISLKKFRRLREQGGEGG